jgi:GTP-binding protein
LADLPGYGYARVSKTMSAEWQRLIVAYLHGRPQLRRVCLLLDARHGANDNDHVMMKMLDEAAASFLIILTKIDKLKPTELSEAVNAANAIAKNHVRRDENRHAGASGPSRGPRRNAL